MWKIWRLKKRLRALRTPTNEGKEEVTAAKSAKDFSEGETLVKRGIKSKQGKVVHETGWGNYTRTIIKKGQTSASDNWGTSGRKFPFSDLGAQ